MGTQLDARADSVRLGAGFLKAALREGRYGLWCHGDDGAPRFSHDKGHLFSGCFVAEAIAERLDEVERALLLVRVLSECQGGRWGYSPRGYGPPAGQRRYFVDADDTAFALRTLQRLGVYHPPAVLRRFRRARCPLPLPGTAEVAGFVTFASLARARLETAPSPRSNLGLHPEVNANVFLALLDTAHPGWISLDLVRRAQAPDGSWPGYFYPSRTYATHLFLRVCSRYEALRPERERGLAFLRATQRPDGSWGGCFDTALAVAALRIATGGEGDEVARGRAALLERQGPEGAWRDEAVIWAFHRAEGDVWRAVDRHHVVTTALCLSALGAGGAPG